MRKEKLGCWSFLSVIILSFLVGSFSGGLLGGVTGFWSAQEFRPTPVFIKAPTPGPTATVIPVVPTEVIEPRSVAVDDMVEVVEMVAPAVVTVINLQAPVRDWWGNISQPQALGTGAVIDAQRGYIVTNNHVVEGAQSLSVLMPDGEKIPAQLVGTDRYSDLAVLRVQTNKPLTAVSFGDSDTLRPGQRVIAIGSALGEFENTVTAGIISGLNRSIEVDANYSIEGLIQTDASINRGNSGGPLANLNGEVVGINTMVIRGGGVGTNIVEGLGFAIPSNMVVSITEQLIEKGAVARPYLGIRYLEVTPQLASYYDLSVDKGILVTQIVANSGAHLAGLQPGDVIVSIGGQPIDEDNHFINVLMRFQVGDTVKVAVNRFGEELEFEVALKAREN